METEVRHNKTEITLEVFTKSVKSELKKSYEGRANHGLLEMASYHFETFGKLLRPQVIFHLGRSFKIPTSNLLGWAVCCELLHNATLIHDDIQDGDEVRRGRKTIWNQFGKNQAINLGDFLIFVAPTPIYSSHINSQTKLALLNTLLEMSARLVDGQNLEFELNQISCPQDLKDKYTLCVKNKTAALFSGMAEGVAILAELAPDRKKSLIDLFESIGVLFQIQDDLLDLYGDKQRGEKGCDIKEGKISFLLVHLFQKSPKLYQKAIGILHKSRYSTEQRDIQLIQNWIESSGALDSALKELENEWQGFQANPLLQENLELRLFVHGFLEKIFEPIEGLVNFSLSGNNL